MFDTSLRYLLNTGRIYKETRSGAQNTETRIEFRCMYDILTLKHMFLFHGGHLLVPFYEEMELETTRVALTRLLNFKFWPRECSRKNLVVRGPVV